MIIGSGERIVFIGDSITDCGRGRPIGEHPWPGLGSGYVSILNSMMVAHYPERLVRIFNAGTSGNTVRDLAARWQTDVLDLKPDWLCVMIGINDVWRHFDNPTRPEVAVGLEEYRDTLDRLIAETRGQVKGIFLATPFYIEPNRADLMRAMMDRYGNAAREIAARRDCRIVDVQAGFDAYTAHRYPGTLAADRVHPDQTGHLIIANAFWSAIA